MTQFSMTDVRSPAVSLSTRWRSYQESQVNSVSTHVIILVALGTVLALCGLVYGAGVLRILFPAAAVAVGLMLYLRSQASYLSYTFIVWFVSPLVRRLIDLRAGWVDPSPVLLAPLLVTLISTLDFPSIFRGNPKFRWPYMLAISGVLYGVGISFVRSGPAGVTVPLLNFVAPIFFGAYIVSNWSRCHQLAEAFDRILICGVLVMGIYGIAQYQFAPAWDTNWMINEDNATFGRAEPLGIRVFSTLNSPIPFGDVMMAGLLILANRRGWAGRLVPLVGYLALGLSLARTAWLGWVTGISVLVISSKLTRVRVVFGVVLLSIVAPSLASTNPITDVISKRIQTFASPKQDFSFSVRLAAYEQYVGALLADPFGQGISNQGYEINTKVGFGPHDSAVLEVLRCLGWVGGLAYLVAVTVLIRRAIARSDTEEPAFQSYRAIAYGLVPAALFASVFLSVSGVVFWTVLSLASAHQLQVAGVPEALPQLDECGHSVRPTRS